MTRPEPGPGRRGAGWHGRAHQARAAGALAPWLTEQGSLTARLMAHSSAFRVRRLHQRHSVCLRDEAAQIGLARPQQVWEREVLLVCDGRPVVFAHTVVPLTASSADWPLFGGLGERSLGSTLFGDRRVVRGTLQFARLAPGHALARRARAALAATAGNTEEMEANGALWARRCLYRRNQGWLLVTEVFLPGIENLRSKHARQPQNNNE